jgi:hypothetical protein
MHNIESPRADDAGVEPELAARAAAPRVTLEQLELAIRSETYTILPSGKVTVCELTLYNGFTVRGESAVVDPANFREDIGRRFSREKAVNKVWELLGFQLQDRLHRKAQQGVDDGTDRVERIARVCHEVNRAYCEALGDLSQRAWEDAPDWQRESARKGVVLHLGDPDAGPQASHASWMAEKVATGWTWGPLKDEAKKEHHCMVPFEHLPREQQAKDYIFRAVVHALASS